VVRPLAQRQRQHHYCPRGEQFTARAGGSTHYKLRVLRTPPPGLDREAGGDALGLFLEPVDEPLRRGCEDTAVRSFNLLGSEFDQSSARNGYEWRGARVGQTLGAEQIGACLYELAEGQRVHPYHFHHGIEEWVLVVAGSPLARTTEGERALRPGDVLCFPAGPGGAHQITGPGTVLMISENATLDTVEYPDSGKVGVYPPGKVFRSVDAVDAWEGE
jgi:uncharacterized cupin superfamily protein